MILCYHRSRTFLASWPNLGDARTTCSSTPASAPRPSRPPSGIPRGGRAPAGATRPRRPSWRLRGAGGATRENRLAWREKTGPATSTSSCSTPREVHGPQTHTYTPLSITQTRTSLKDGPCYQYFIMQHAEGGTCPSKTHT